MFPNLPRVFSIQFTNKSWTHLTHNSTPFKNTALIRETDDRVATSGGDLSTNFVVQVFLTSVLANGANKSLLRLLRVSFTLLRVCCPRSRLLARVLCLRSTALAHLRSQSCCPASDESRVSPVFSRLESALSVDNIFLYVTSPAHKGEEC